MAVNNLDIKRITAPDVAIKKVRGSIIIPVPKCVMALIKGIIRPVSDCIVVFSKGDTISLMPTLKPIDEYKAGSVTTMSKIGDSDSTSRMTNKIDVNSPDVQPNAGAIEHLNSLNSVLDNCMRAIESSTLTPLGKLDQFFMVRERIKVALFVTFGEIYTKLNDDQISAVLEGKKILDSSALQGTLERENVLLDKIISYHRQGVIIPESYTPEGDKVRMHKEQFRRAYMHEIVKANRKMRSLNEFFGPGRG